MFDSLCFYTSVLKHLFVDICNIILVFFALLFLYFVLFQQTTIQSELAIDVYIIVLCLPTFAW